MSSLMADNAPLNDAVARLLARGIDAPMRRRKGGSVHLDLDVLTKSAALEKAEQGRGPMTLEKTIANLLNQQGEVERLAFEVDPTESKYAGIWKQKQRLLPDKLIKRILIQDELVASIVQARQNQISAFGRPRPDRFSTGFVIELRQETIEKIEREKDPDKKAQAKQELQERIAKASKLLLTCGEPDAMTGDGAQDRLTFSQYLSMSTRNAVGVGRIATEVVMRPDPQSPGGERFSCFRVIDAGTIYRAEPQKSALEELRHRAAGLLEQLKDRGDGKDKKKRDKIEPKRFLNDEYAWVQVIDDRPMQAFTAKECRVHNFYMVPDVELDGYPVTPLDMAISAVTTHINITTHNKLYFQSGRAARGMLVIKSDDVDDATISKVRQQFNAQINSVSNAWRMPVFGVGAEEDITWQPIESGGRDMEFQYLADANARTILSVFQMAPEELPGWSYLSRGTNNQALSEGNNEYKLEAARDIGIRPLLAQFEDFLNHDIMPLLDPKLAAVAVLKLVGLDAETAEKESVRLQQDMPVHMTYDEVLAKVEKKALGKRLGGEFPLNPAYQAILDKYVPVGVIQKEFFGIKDADKDPQWAYVRDPFWFQMQQMMQQQQAQQQQAQQQAQQAQQQAVGGGGGPDGGGGGDDGGGAPGGDGGGAKTEGQKTEESGQPAPAAESSAPADLTRSLDQALGLLSKSEQQLPEDKKRLLKQHRRLIRDYVEGVERDADAATREILEAVGRLGPNRPRA